MSFPTIEFPTLLFPPIVFPSVQWGETSATFVPLGGALPEAPITAALVFALQAGAFVLADIAGRGWCIPGGRLEPGETPEQAAHRETHEEIGAILGPLEPLGHYILSPIANPTTVTTSPGSEDAVEQTSQSVAVPHTQTPDARLRLAIAYRAEVETLTPLPAGTESRGVRRCSFTDLPTVYYAWDPLLEAMFHYVVHGSPTASPD